MKRILLLAMISCAAHFATAQQKPDLNPPGTEKTKNDKGAYITLQAAQVVLVNDNKAEKLEKDRTLADGTIVTVTGVIKKSDGTSVQMKEGDRVYLDGGLSLSKKDNAPM